MADLPAKLKPVADKLRGLKAKLGVTTYSVSVRIRTFSGQDLDGYTQTVTTLLTGGFAAPVRVLSQRDVILSGGLYNSNDLEVTLTPAYEDGDTDGGYLFNALDPAPGASPQEVVFIVTGDGLPTGGAVFKKIGTRVTPFTYLITIRNTGAKP